MKNFIPFATDILAKNGLFLVSAVVNDLFNEKLGFNEVKQESDEYLGLDDNFDILKYASDPTLAQAAQLSKLTQFNQATQQPPKQKSSNTHLQHLLSSDITTLQPELQLQQQQNVKLEPKPEAASPPSLTTLNTALLNAVQQSQLPPNVQQLLQLQLAQQLLQQQQQSSTLPAVKQPVQITPTQNTKTQKIIVAQPVQQQQTLTTASPPAQIIINAQPQQPTVGTVGQVSLQQLQQVL